MADSVQQVLWTREVEQLLSSSAQPAGDLEHMLYGWEARVELLRNLAAHAFTGGQPLVARSLVALGGPPVERVALVVAPAHLAEGRALARRVPVPCVVVPGGARRQDSVRNGLLALGPCGLPCEFLRVRRGRGRYRQG